MTISHGYGRRTSTIEMLTPYNVRDFGAVGDALSDDSDAIQDCLDHARSASSLGALVYFPPGRYLCASTIDLSDAFQTLVIVGVHTNTQTSGTRLIYSGTGNFFNLEGADNIFFRNIRIGFSKASAYTGSLIYAKSTSRVHLETCYLGYDNLAADASGSYTHGSSPESILVNFDQSAIIWKIQDCRFRGGGTAIKTLDGNNRTLIDNCYFDSIDRDSIFMTGPGRASAINHCTFQNSPNIDSATFANVRIIKGASFKPQGIEIANNYFETGPKIVDPPSSGALKNLHIVGLGVNITGNWFGTPSAANMTAIHFDGTDLSTGVSITGNIIGGTSGSSNYATGIHFNSGAHDGILLAGNKFSTATTTKYDGIGSLTNVNGIASGVTTADINKWNSVS